MAFRSLGLFRFRCSCLSILFSLIACLAGFTPELQAQTAHFSGAARLLGNGLAGSESVAVDSKGNLFVADLWSYSVKEFVAADGYSTARILGNLSYPTGVALDSNGNVFVGDEYWVREFLAETDYATMRTLASGFGSAEDVAVDSTGNVFVSDTAVGNGVLKEIVAVSGSIPVSPTVKTVASGTSYAKSIAVDGSGNIFWVDPGGSSVTELLAVDGSIPTTPTIKHLGSGLSFPYGMALDSGGNVFVADLGANAIKEVMADGGYATVKTIGVGYRFPHGVAVDTSGNIFVVGPQGKAEITEITATADFGSVSVGSVSPTPLALYFTFDVAGTLGSTAVLTQGAANLDFIHASGKGTCFAGTTYNPGDRCFVNVNFKPTYPGPRFGAVELLDTSGKLLATGYVQGTGVGPIATFANSTSGVDLPSKQTTLSSAFYWPIGVAADSSGNIFVADTHHNAVKEILAAGGYTTVKTLGNGFSMPWGVAVDGAGNVFVADHDNNAVKEILAVGGYTTVKTVGSGFTWPAGVAVDGSGNVFVDEQENTVMKEILAASGYTTIKTVGSGFNHPRGMAVDGSGNVFVGDTTNKAVKEILAVGGYSTVNTLGSGFNCPMGVAVDASGNVIVSDTCDNAMKEILSGTGGAAAGSVNSSSTVKTLVSDWPGISYVAADGRGNLFVAQYGENSAVKLDYADPPSLTFAGTSVGVQSSDSPQIVTVSNNGNADLTFAVPVSDSNPAISSGDFTLDAATTCPQLNAGSTAGTLAAGASCDYAVDFIPVPAGADSGSLTLTDDSLNASPAVSQTIPLSGTVIGPHLAFTTPPPSSLQVGHVPGTVAVSVEDSSNNVETTSSAMVTLTVTGPNSYVNVYTATASSGVATFSSLASLSAVGSYSYTATDTADGLTQAVATETAWAPPPFGRIGAAVDDVTLNATVGQSDSVRVSGWVADATDGAPLGNVQVFIDGTPAGTPTMGIPRTDVVEAYNNNAYLNSGYRVLYSASSLSIGTHQVTVVATNSGGQSTTFGPRKFTVAATAGVGSPFGGIDEAGDSVTASTTISQSGTLKVSGWVVDSTDGAPLSNVTVYMDGVSIGTPTLGLKRPDIPAALGKDAYLHAGYRMLYPALGLGLGTHQVTVVAIDSGGRSTTFGPRTITVQ
jgi:sugar lactone lactonase YvrE